MTHGARLLLFVALVAAGLWIWLDGGDEAPRESLGDLPPVSGAAEQLEAAPALVDESPRRYVNPDVEQMRRERALRAAHPETQVVTSVEYGRIRGRILSRSGQPLARYGVMAMQIESAGNSIPSHQAVSDERGDYLIDRVPPGTYDIYSYDRIDQATFGEGWIAARVEVIAGEEAWSEITILGDRTVAGIVCSDLSGATIELVLVPAWDPDRVLVSKQLSPTNRVAPNARAALFDEKFSYAQFKCVNLEPGLYRAKLVHLLPVRKEGGGHTPVEFVIEREVDIRNADVLDWVLEVPQSEIDEHFQLAYEKQQHEER